MEQTSKAKKDTKLVEAAKYEKLTLTKEEAVLKYYVLKALPVGKDLPELAGSYLLKEEDNSELNTIEVEQAGEDEEQKYTTITVKAQRAGDKPLAIIHITWIQSQEFLDLIGSSGNFRPSFHRTAMFVDTITMLVLPKLARKLNSVQYNQELVGEDWASISPTEVANRALENDSLVNEI